MDMIYLLATVTDSTVFIVLCDSVVPSIYEMFLNEEYYFEQVGEPQRYQAHIQYFPTYHH